jgi:hypothetical protein
MTVHSRSDVVAVTISPAHGGCGRVHSRPVVAGAPARLWALDCADGCEDVLRHDPLWAPTVTTIPETPDEAATREDAEKRGQIEQAKNTTAALQDLANLKDLPQALSQALLVAFGGQNPQAVEEPQLLCKNGHANKPTGRFCAECGTSLKEPVSATGTDNAPADDAAPDLESMSINELRELAKSMGVKTARSKDDQITAIRDSLGK